MKQTGFIVLLIILINHPLFGQVESKEETVSGFPVEDWYELNVDETVIQTLKDIVPSKNEAFRFAFPFKLNLHPGNSGYWREYDNEKIWTIGLRSKGAKSLNLILEPFNLKAGSFLYIYNSDRSGIIGPVGAENNSNYGILPVSPVPGEEIILEYHVPAGTSWEGTLGISQAAHDYRGIFLHDSKDGRFGLSGSCNIDILCDEGSVFGSEKRSVCRLIVNGTELCTGFLVNNTSQQNRALLVTAEHCIENDDQAAKTIFVFGYESPWCDGPDGRTLHSISGSSLLARNKAIDFSLVELSSFPPVTFKPYLAGWDVRGSIPLKSAVIHHPQGDVKKITLDDNSPQTSSFLDFTANGFWKVLQWEKGTTESGSSGAPLFDENKRVIGILSGGEAECGRSVNDYFSRLSVAYNLSDDLWQQLKGWIDPGVTGLKFLAGRDPYAPNLLSADTLSNFNQGENILLTKYPVGAKGYSTGFNSDSITGYAEYFTNSVGTGIIEVIINTGDVNSVSSTDSARIYIYAGGEYPGAVIASQKIFLKEMKDSFELKVDFKNTVPVTGNFFAGWKIWYRSDASLEQRQFAVFHSPDRIVPSGNTAFFHDGSDWKKFMVHPEYPMAISLDVKVVTIPDSQVNNIESKKVRAPEFTVYPNPADHWLVVSSEKKYVNTRMEIIDSQGSVLELIEIHDGFNDEFRTDISALNTGIYFLCINAGNIRECHKFIVIR